MKKRILIIALHKCGQSQSEIFILLKRLGNNRLFVFCMVKRYNKMGDMVDNPRQGHPQSVHLPNLTHVVRECVRLNPLQKQKRVAVEMSMTT